MAIDWNEGVPLDTIETEPAFCVFYAGAKAGKTTLASEFPSPLYVRTGKLWVAVIAHAMTNGVLGVWVVALGHWAYW